MPQTVRSTRRSSLPTLVMTAMLSALFVFGFTAVSLPGTALASVPKKAACSVNLRTSPYTTARRKTTRRTGTRVTVVRSVTGGFWRATCAGKTVSGRSWYRISAINGRSVKSLYGVTYLYGATGLFRSVSTATPTPTPTPTLTSPATGNMYGSAVGADDLNNTIIGGPNDQVASYRFRAERTSTLLSFRVYVIGPAKAGYGAGTGGTIRATVETDDGTAVHGPSGVVLATRDFTPTDGAGNVYTFTSSPNLTGGRLYHIRFTNIDGNPAANYISLDGTYQAATVGQWQPLGPNVDFAQVLKIGNNPWTESRGSGTSVITPMLDLTYGDGSHQGMGYIETWGRGGRDGYNTADGSNALREVFTVNGQSLSVSQVSVRLARTSGSGDLSLRLETSGGVGIETVTIPAAGIASASKGGHGFGQTWHTVSFASSHVLASGSTYNLVLTTTTGTEYWLTAIRQGGSYGYTSATYFGDGHAQINRGGGWTDVRDLSGNPNNQADLQFYFR